MNFTRGPGRRCISTSQPRAGAPSIVGVVATTATIAGILAAGGCTRTPPARSSQPGAVLPYVCPTGHGTCQGPLAAGTYRTDSFLPAIVYSVADGWTNTEDLDRSFRFTRVDHTRPVRTSAFVDIYLDRFPAVAPCTEPPSTAGSSGAATISRWLHNPALIATRPTAVTIGGLPGHMLTVIRNPSFSVDCPPSPLAGGSPPDSHPPPHDGTKTLYVLAVGTATIIIDVTHLPGRNAVEQYRRLTDPIVNSLAFFPPRGPNPPTTAAIPRARTRQEPRAESARTIGDTA